MSCKKFKQLFITLFCIISASYSYPLEIAQGANSNLLKDVQTMPDRGRWHLPADETHIYTSYPPASGPHSPTSIKPGFYAVKQPFEKLVHSMEHGNVIIYYGNHTDESVLQQLQEIAKEYPVNFSGVIVTPYPEIGSRIILTAWTKKLVLESFDRKTITAFITTYKSKGPEND